MKVRMLADRTGGRFDGQDWPVPPGEIDVTDAEAQHLIAAGHAEAVSQPDTPKEPAAPSARPRAAKQS